MPDGLSPVDRIVRLLRTQLFALHGRLLKKVYEVDPFLCPKCSGTMVVVGVIEDPVKLKAIIEWSSQRETDTPEVRGPPLDHA